MGILNNFRKAQRELVIGKLYSFDELTPQEQADAIDAATSEFPYKEDMSEFQYRLHLLEPHQQDPEYADPDTDIDTPEFQSFMQSLREGQENIGVGFEGRHRALAFFEMNLPMYWFEIIRNGESIVFQPDPPAKPE